MRIVLLEKTESRSAGDVLEVGVDVTEDEARDLLRERVAEAVTKKRAERMETR